MKNFYFNGIFEPAPGKYYAAVVKIPCNNNILPLIQRCKDLIILHSTPTKSEAYKIMDLWNNQYKINGTYYFDRSDKNDTY